MIARILRWVGIVTWVTVVGCPKPAADPVPETPVTRELTLRVLGNDGGATVWITTGNDGEADGRYDGEQLVIDPVDPDALLAALEREGVTRIDVVVMGSPEEDAVAALQKLAASVDIGLIAGIPARSLPEDLRERTGTENANGFQPHSMSYGGPSRGVLPLGREINVRMLRPTTVRPFRSRGVELRFIDWTMLFAFDPDVEETEATNLVVGLRELNTHIVRAHPEISFVRHGGHVHENEHDHDNDPHAAGESHVHMDSIELDLPAAGETWIARTDGSETRFPGGLYRNRFGVYFRCAAECDTQLSAAHAEPLIVELEIPAGNPGWFLIESRASASYLETSRYLSLPGVDSTEVGSHSHGSGGPGIPVSHVKVGELQVDGLKMLPIDAMQLQGRDIAGVVGRNLLESFAVSIAPSSRQVTLSLELDREKTRSLIDATTEGNKTTLPMDWSPAGPLILSRVDGQARSLVVSTGTDTSLVSMSGGDGKFETREGAWLRIEDTTNPQWVPYDAVEKRVVSSLELAGVELADQMVWVPERSERVDILGTDFLSQFENVTLDFRGKQLILERTQ